MAFENSPNKKDGEFGGLFQMGNKLKGTYYITCSVSCLLRVLGCSSLVLYRLLSWENHMAFSIITSFNVCMISVPVFVPLSTVLFIMCLIQAVKAKRKKSVVKVISLGGASLLLWIVNLVMLMYYSGF